MDSADQLCRILESLHLATDSELDALIRELCSVNFGNALPLRRTPQCYSFQMPASVWEMPAEILLQRFALPHPRPARLEFKPELRLGLANKSKCDILVEPFLLLEPKKKRLLTHEEDADAKRIRR